MEFRVDPSQNLVNLHNLKPTKLGEDLSGKGIDNLFNGPSKEEQVAQLEKQWNKELHTVYRKGGQIVGVLGKDGGFTSTNGIGSVLHKTIVDAQDAGLTTDQMAKEIEKQLSAMGMGVTSETYPPKSGVTVGMAQDEMFNRGPDIPSASELRTGANVDVPKVKTSNEMWALLQELNPEFF